MYNLQTGDGWYVANGIVVHNCHHTIVRWHPGFTWPPHSLHNRPGTYAAVQRQRDIERHIREWKRREAVALDDVTALKAKTKVRAWQAELRRHLAAEGLTRSRQRERADFRRTAPFRHAHAGPENGGPARNGHTPRPRPKPPKPEPKREPLKGGAAYEAAPGRRHESVPEDAARALYGYTGGDFNWVNPRLRGNPMPYGTDDDQLAETDRQIADMRRGFAAVPPLAEPVEVWRGVSGVKDMFGAPGSKVGQSFTDKAFTSTSTSEMRAGHFGQALIRIRVPAGTKAIAMGREEMELLLPDGSRFRVVSDEVIDGRRRIELELL